VNLCLRRVRRKSATASRDSTIRQTASGESADTQRKNGASIPAGLTAAPDSPLGQILGKARQQPLSIACAIRPALLEFNNACAYQPVAEGQELVHCCRSAHLGSHVQTGDGLDQSAVVQPFLRVLPSDFVMCASYVIHSVPQSAGEDAAASASLPPVGQGRRDGAASPGTPGCVRGRQRSAFTSVVSQVIPPWGLSVSIVLQTAKRRGRPGFGWRQGRPPRPRSKCVRLISGFPTGDPCPSPLHRRLRLFLYRVTKG